MESIYHDSSLNRRRMNKSYGEWGEIFKDHVIASDVLDRILHHSTAINIKGESYRLKERKKQRIKTGNVYQ